MKKIHHGDTIIEVCICVTVFAIVCIITIGLMNNGLNLAQRTLEVTMARTAIDSQAEALRYIHNNYVAERNFGEGASQFKKIWDRLKDYSRGADRISSSEYTDTKFSINSYDTCETALRKQKEVFHAFVVNPRLILPDIYNSYRGVSYTPSGSEKGVIDNILIHESALNPDGSLIKEASLYPRIIYQTTNSADADKDTSKLKEDNSKLFQFVNAAEGIWVIGIFPNEEDVNRSEFFDFYIRTCWNPAGAKNFSTITTIVRLYNPETIQNES